MYKQQFLRLDWLKTCQLLPNQWNFTSATLNHIQFVFFITISKITKEIFAKICWQLKTTTRTWKCTRCIMQMSYLYASYFPFKNFCKIAQHTETIQKNVWEKSNDAYWLSIRVQTMINHIFVFIVSLRQYQHQRKCFLSERELKKAMAGLQYHAIKNKNHNHSMN